MFGTYLKNGTSLYWLLEEPLVHGARLDMACEATPGLSQILCSSKVLKLHDLMDIGELSYVILKLWHLIWEFSL